MNGLSIAEKPPVVGIGASQTGGTEKPVETTTAEVLPGSSVVNADAGGVASQIDKPGRWGEVNVTLTPLQRMIQEILDPLALRQRSVKEWRCLYKAFFAFFAPTGGADETERKAWAIAAEVFNTNLVAVSNRTTQVVPMTFQDFVDGVDSFRHDGLREGAQRDIAWQPKKILLLMAAMIGRIISGWQADLCWWREWCQDLVHFRNYLIAENRNAAFLRSVFDYDPRFSILEYRAAGLKPLLHAFPHFAYVLMENGIYRCEFCAARAADNPPLLRAHFRRPLRAPIPMQTISTLNFVLLQKPLPLTAGSGDSEPDSSCFEFSRTALDALAFEPSEAPEIRCSKIERLFELAVTDGLLLCAPHRAVASTAARIGKTLGRTQAEQFVIERFFALGFRNGHGNEPWLDQTTNDPLPLDSLKVKKARKQFGHWKNTSMFFLKAGRPQAADIPGARFRQDVLQPKGSDLFLSLLNTPVYAPLMSVFLAADGQGKWVIDEPELHAFARSLNGGAGRILFENGGAITRCVDSFHEQETESVFLFECALGILLRATDGNKSPRRLAALEKAKDALRKNYERLFAVSLSAAPSVLRANSAESTAQLVETKRRFQETDPTIIRLLGEPLNRKVSEHLRRILATLPKPAGSFEEHTVPCIHLENQTAFEESISSLCAWITSKKNQAPSASLSCSSQLLPEAQGPRAHQAEALLRDYAEELSLAENRLEQEFLKAVRAGSDADFHRKEKLRNRLQRHTRWGGREPFQTTLKLLQSVTERGA